MNKSLQIFIVEDEPLICATIETALLKQGFKIVGDADNVIEAFQAIETSQPDLVLIDIQLEGVKDGIELALKLDQIDIPYLYLTSQTDPETIERIKHTKPIGYVVKPFTENGLRSNIALAWHNYKESNKNYIKIKHEGRLHKLNQNDIIYLKAYDNYCYINTKTSQYLIPHTLKHTLERLDPENFLKSHRSYAVNIKHVTSINTNKVYLGDLSLPLSLSKKKQLLKFL